MKPFTISTNAVLPGLGDKSDGPFRRLPPKLELPYLARTGTPKITMMGEAATRAEYPLPKTATIKELYGTAFRCAHPDCLKPLYRLDNETGDFILNSRVAHIHARRPNGPRWIVMDPEENRSTRNLLPLCIEHSYEVDDKTLESRYPAELLREWKQEQLAEYQRMQRSWPLSDSEAEDIARISFDPAIAGHGQAVLAVARGVAKLITVGRRERDRPRMQVEAWRETYERVRASVVAWDSEGERVYAEPPKVDTDRHRTAVIDALLGVLAILSPLADAVQVELAAVRAGSPTLWPWCDWVGRVMDEVLAAAGVWSYPPPFEDDGRFNARLVELQHAADSLAAKWRGETVDDPPPVPEQAPPSTQDAGPQGRLREHQKLLERARPYARVDHRPYDGELTELLCLATTYAATIPRIPSTLPFDLHATASLAAAVARNADPAEFRSLILDCSQRRPLAAGVLLLRELMFTAQRTGQDHLQQEAASLGMTLLSSADWSEHKCWEENEFHAAFLLDLEASVNGTQLTRARIEAALQSDRSLLAHVLRGSAGWIEHRNSRSMEPMGCGRSYSMLPAWFPTAVVVAEIKAQFSNLTANDDWESRRYDDEIEQLAAQVLHLAYE